MTPEQPSQTYDPQGETTKRGGARPGAGAPKGNLNALKPGRYSQQLRAFLRLVVATPGAADLLKRLVRHRMGMPEQGERFGDPVELYFRRFE